jgi:hypothetical protein
MYYYPNLLIDSEKFKENMEKLHEENQKLDWPTKDSTEAKKKEESDDDEADA